MLTGGIELHRTGKTLRPVLLAQWVSTASPRAVLAAALSQILGRGPHARAGPACFLAGADAAAQRS